MSEELLKVLLKKFLEKLSKENMTNDRFFKDFFLRKWIINKKEILEEFPQRILEKFLTFKDARMFVL